MCIRCSMLIKSLGWNKKHGSFRTHLILQNKDSPDHSRLSFFMINKLFCSFPSWRGINLSSTTLCSLMSTRIRENELLTFTPSRYLKNPSNTSLLSKTNENLVFSNASGSQTSRRNISGHLQTTSETSLRIAQLYALVSSSVSSLV